MHAWPSSTPRAAPPTKRASPARAAPTEPGGHGDDALGLNGGSARTFGLFNLTPPPGWRRCSAPPPSASRSPSAARSATAQANTASTSKLRTSPRAWRSTGQVTVWGTPWAVSHDPERGNCLNEAEPSFGWAKCSVGPPKDNPPQAFLTLPNSCTGPLHYAASADSWQQPGEWVGDNAISRDAEGNPQECSAATGSTSPPPPSPNPPPTGPPRPPASTSTSPSTRKAC